MKVFLWISLILLFALNFYSHNTFAGYERGNGGMQIVCSSGSSLGGGVFSLDRIEGEIFFKRRPAQSLKYLNSENEIVQHVLQKLKVVNPTRAHLYEKWLGEIISKREFITDMDIQPINDGDVVILPQGCKAKQAAVFVTNFDQSQIRFLFDQSLWNASAPLDRAFLLLHELIYREARLPENQHINSMSSRHINSWLFANIDNLSPENWRRLLRDSNFVTTDYSNIPIVLNYKTMSGEMTKAPIELFPGTYKIKKAILYHTFSIKIGGNRVFSRDCPLPKDIPSRLTYFDQVEFYPSGVLKHIIFSISPLYNPGPGCELFDGKNSLEFSEDGKLIRASVNNRPTIFPDSEQSPP